MRTSRVRSCSERGFTLIEFAVVLLVLGMIFALVIPRLPRRSDESPLRRSARRLSEAIRSLKDEALVSSAPLRLRLRFDDGGCAVERLGETGEWTPSAGPPLAEDLLEKPVRLARVQVGRRPPVTRGEAFVHFYPTGESDAAVLVLTDGHRETRSLVVHPYLSRVEIEHGRVERAGS